MKLIGSKPSPYVRRIRLFLEEVDYDFVVLDYISQEGREQLRRNTPAMKVPVLVDGDTTIYDSRVIYNYLNEKLQKETLTWEQQNTLTLVDAVNDSLVIMLLISRSGIDAGDDALVTQLQRARIAETLAVLEKKAEAGEFAQWQYPSICLYCLLDWVMFRELYDLSGFPSLLKFHGEQAARESVQSTDPR